LYGWVDAASDAGEGGGLYANVPNPGPCEVPGGYVADKAVYQNNDVGVGEAFLAGFTYPSQSHLPTVAHRSRYPPAMAGTMLI
jgi:hypothetical protein